MATLLAIGQRPSGFQTPSFVQAEQFSTADSTVEVTFASNNTAGNLLVIGIFIGNTSSTVSSVTDTRGNTYAAATSISSNWSSNGRVQIYYAYNCAAGANTVTATISSSVRTNVHLGEYSNILAVSDPLDVTASGTAGDDPTSGSASTTQDNDLVYGFIACAGGAPTAGSGFTKRSDYVFDQYSAFEDKVLTTAGSTSATWTTVSTNTGIAQMATFKAKPL